MSKSRRERIAALYEEAKMFGWRPRNQVRQHLIRYAKFRFRVSQDTAEDYASVILITLQEETLQEESRNAQNTIRKKA